MAILEEGFSFVVFWDKWPIYAQWIIQLPYQKLLDTAFLLSMLQKWERVKFEKKAFWNWGGKKMFIWGLINLSAQMSCVGQIYSDEELDRKSVKWSKKNLNWKAQWIKINLPSIAIITCLFFKTDWSNGISQLHCYDWKAL